jgi:hypothetical protein
MRTDRSPGAWSGSEFSGWFVDAVNGLAGARFARAAPDDEDITSIHTMNGPITRSRARQLNLQDR